MKKKTKPIKKKLFFFSVPIWDREICVIVGLTYKEAISAAKKQKCTKNFIECMESDFVKDRDFWTEKRVDGEAMRVNPENYFILLRPYKNDWKYLDTLSHECFHLVQFMGHSLNFWDNTEPPAYLHQFLFAELRKILSGYKKEG